MLVVSVLASPYGALTKAKAAIMVIFSNVNLPLSLVCCGITWPDVLTTNLLTQDKPFCIVTESPQVII